MLKKLDLLFVVLIPFLLASCQHAANPRPEIIVKKHSPRRGGIVEHDAPWNSHSKMQYELASAKLIRNYCGGSDFKIKAVGEKSKKVRLGFECVASNKPTSDWKK